MNASEPTHTTLEEISKALAEHESFCICGHINPDGDCIGSELALAHCLQAIGKNAACLLATHDGSIDQNLLFLPGAQNLMSARDYHDPVDVFVALDVPNYERLGDAADLHKAANLTITIDHHACDDPISDLVHIDSSAASTTLMIWQIAKLLGTQDLSSVATCCYLGLMTDTGRFQYQNVDAEAFARASEMVEAGADPADISQHIYQNKTIASLRLEEILIERMRLFADGQVVLSWITRDDMRRVGAAKSDAEPLIDVLRSIKNVRVACILRENENEIRGSLRAKDNTDVAALAHEFGGGGHKAAAGFTVKANINEAIDIITRRLTSLFVCD